MELETTEEERAEWTTAYSVETYRIQAMGRLVRDFAKLQAELARLRPLADDAGRLREALDTIAGGWINRFPGAPNIMKVSPTDFQHGMWSWSQAVAKAALSPAQSQEPKP